MRNNSTAGFLEKCVLDGYPALEPSTVCVIKAAMKHNLKVEILDEARSFIKVYNDEQTEYIKEATKTSKDVSTFPFVTDNKEIVKDILRENNINTPNGIIIQKGHTKRDLDYLIAPFVGKSVVVKPNTTNRGVGITVFENPVTQKDLQAAVKNAFRHDSQVIIEEFKKGLEYRFLVIGDECVCVIHRRAASVVGDGKTNINDLITLKNQEPWHGLSGRLIVIDDSLKQILKRQHYSLRSVPEKGKRVYLRDNSNCSTGGESIDLTDQVPDEFKRIAVKAAKLFNAKICGVDILIENFNKFDYSIVELNDNPGIGICECPYEGKGRPIGDYILRLLEFIE
ncbi:MAG: carboxylate--amine ligase [Bacilli bacterium]|nr:carboxylate--amine ligase [Bacilli bacterium]